MKIKKKTIGIFWKPWLCIVTKPFTNIDIDQYKTIFKNINITFHKPELPQQHGTPRGWPLSPDEWWGHGHPTQHDQWIYCKCTKGHNLKYADL